MVFEDQYNFESLVNETEELVVAEIGRQLPEYPDLCTCSECILDVAAYALNRVPDIGYLYSIRCTYTAESAAPIFGRSAELLPMASSRLEPIPLTTEANPAGRRQSCPRSIIEEVNI